MGAEDAVKIPAATKAPLSGPIQRCRAHGEAAVKLPAATKAHKKQSPTLSVTLPRVCLSACLRDKHPASGARPSMLRFYQKSWKSRADMLIIAIHYSDK